MRSLTYHEGNDGPIWLTLQRPVTETFFERLFGLRTELAWGRLTPHADHKGVKHETS